MYNVSILLYTECIETVEKGLHIRDYPGAMTYTCAPLGLAQFSINCFGLRDDR